MFERFEWSAERGSCLRILILYLNIYSTTSPGLLLASMMRSSKSKGFCVGYPNASFDPELIRSISCQKSLSGTPGESSSFAIGPKHDAIESSFCVAYISSV